MSQHRAPLLLILFAAILVSGGHAAPIHKFAIDRDFGFHSAYASYGLTSTDNWLGGTGNWSDSWCWDSGLPSGGSDVVIYSGGDDLVYLDASASIASLTLGGWSGTSQLVDNGTPQTLTIAGALTINWTGTLSLNGGDTVAAASLSVNSGAINLNGGSTLQVYGDANNSGSLTLGSSSGGNSLIVNGRLTNQGSFTLYASSANVGSLDGGVLDLENGSFLQVNGDASTGYASMMNGSSMFVAGSLVTGGMIDLENGSGLQVNGDASGFFLLNGSGLAVNGTLDGGLALYGSSASVGGSANAGGIDLEGSGLGISGDANIGSVSMSSSGMGVGGNMDSGGISMDHSSLTVNGMLTSQGFSMVASGAVVGSLVNYGNVDLDNWSSLQVNGDATNSGSISLGGMGSGHNLLRVDGMLTNHGLLEIDPAGYWTNTAKLGSLANDGTIDLMGNLYVKGNANNSGDIATGPYGSTIIVGGRLTNGPTGTFSLNSRDDVANIGSVVNQGALYIADQATLNVTNSHVAAASALSGFTNTGTVNIAHGGALASPNSYVQTAGQTTVDGSLASGKMINFAGGAVYGNQGTISGPIISNASINIGDALQTIGQLSFMGNYTQGPHGSLTFDIAGSELGQYDQLNVSGHAQLNGLMTVDLLNSFIPQIGNTFDIMNFTSESGTFSMVLGLPINGEEHFVLEYNPTDLTLDVVSGALLEANNGQATLLASDIASSIAADGGSGATSGFTSSTGSHITSDYGRSTPTPEPGSLLLLGSGLLCVGYSVRRRMTK